MKLELKHFVSYLPYGFKVYWDNKEYELNYLKTNNRCQVYFEIQDEIYGVLLKHIKPILRPLSDLTKEEFNYLHTLLRVHIGKNKRDKLINEGYGITDLPYFIFEQFLENHFDLFNLIKNELAIDKNTL